MHPLAPEVGGGQQPRLATELAEPEREHRVPAAFPKMGGRRVRVGQHLLGGQSLGVRHELERVVARG
jgi:hypothetical protein